MIKIELGVSGWLAHIATMPSQAALLLVTILPATAAGAVFEYFLGHRHDYTGHFLAGYGGTLGAMMVWLRTVPERRYAVLSTWGIVPMCVVCILLGAIFEATIFRLAKFDEVDFCNQSLGAVFAAAAALVLVHDPKPQVQLMDFGLIVGIVFLGAGGIYAVA
ncbi:MAG: hypothetical protein ACR2FY_03295 [Pirellulaceae bacterium]